MFCQQLGQRRAAYFQHLLYPSTLCDVLAAVTVVTLPWPVRLHTCAARLPAKEDIDSLGRSEHINWGAHLLDADQDVECRRVERGSPVRLDFPHRRETSLDQRIREWQYTKDDDQSGQGKENVK